jgi:hypothetical protein
MQAMVAGNQVSADKRAPDQCHGISHNAQPFAPTITARRPTLVSSCKLRRQVKALI